MARKRRVFSSPKVVVELNVRSRWRRQVDAQRLKATARRVLRELAHPRVVSIAIVGVAEIAVLNREYHGSTGPTDVLSFANAENESIGDIVISLPTARRNASEAGWSLADELDLLVVHGILHLVGYDDLSASNRRKMWRKQTELLRREIPGPR